MRKLLITAFEPFGGENINASNLVLERLPDVIGDWELTKLTIPVVFGKATDFVVAKASEIELDAIISLGQAAGRDSVTPEYVAINFIDARIPDNDGFQPVREKISQDGPDAYFSTLPVFDMADNIIKKSLPGKVSFSAGTYVCNSLYYSLLDHFSGTEVGVAFIHVPLTVDQATDGQPSMELTDMVQAVKCAIESID